MTPEETKTCELIESIDDVEYRLESLRRLLVEEK